MSPILHSSVKIGRHQLAHRVVMAPLTRMRASEPGAAPSTLNADYYAQRASQSGLIISEASQISWQGKGYPRTPGIHSDEQIAGWKAVVDAVHAKGGVIFMQLWHTGRISHSSHRNDRSLPVSASAVAPAGQAFGAAFERLPYEKPRSLEFDEIPGIVADYKRAARNALAAGFDGVELHGANGYLIDQFLQDRTNRRTDRYGGPIENRVRLLLEATEGLIDVCGADRVGVRLSPFGAVGDMADSDPASLFGHAIEALSARQIAYLHLIEPRANAGIRDGLNHEAPASVTALYRKLFNGPLIASGGFTKQSAEAELKTGNADAIAFGRAFIANPDLPHRFAIGAPLNTPDAGTFYGGGERGYTDYPALVAEGVA
jgi:N-ethylmaleimide reductase